ncbi:MAG: RagB/SusD family nutrient uptake outer membrane protein [Bacteroidetes bacterium]|nr:RagB/SusD family nutrient uptake outer membrane protein [Bacteroidota bacterium]
MLQKISIYTLLSGLLCFSCTRLNNKVYSNIDSDTFVPTEGDLASLVGPAYATLRDLEMGWDALYDLEEICGDELVIPARPNGWVDGGVYKTMHLHTFNSLQPHIATVWDECYTGINNCNRVIYQISAGKIPVTSGKDAILAELRAVRAIYYYVLCDNFGNVPIVTSYDVSGGTLPTQNTRKEVYNFVISELHAVMPMLSANADKSTYGRMNKWSAFTLLAKMYLNAGVYTGTAQWDSCRMVCDSVINSGNYILEPNQEDVFKTENENSQEIIFSIPFDEKYATGFNLVEKTLQPICQRAYNLQASPWGGICAIPQYIKTFDPDDNRLKTNWIQGPIYDANTGQQLDCEYPPLSTSGHKLEFINSLPGIDSSQEIDGFRLGKYEFRMGALFDLSNDCPFFRYADVLMMKAESLLRTGHADDAAAIVTQVRRRSFLANPAKAVVTGAQLQQGSVYQYGVAVNDVIQPGANNGGGDVQYGRFLDELGWEFGMEGRRRADMIRFGIFTTKSWLSHKPNGDYRTIFPIPQPELDKNSNLKQNMGY